jgi:hypothetical protein
MTLATRTGLDNGADIDGALIHEGAPMRNTLRVANDVADAETVVIGADVYEVSPVATDTANNTANGDFNNTTPELTVVDYVGSYPAAPTAVGALIRIENEIMEVIAKYGPNVVLRRGVSNTTIATHADALDIFEEAALPTQGRIAVGLNATLTPAVFTDALIADINNRGSENVKAIDISANEVLLVSADAPGGNAIGSATATATTETLAGANNQWAQATMISGRQTGASRWAAVTHTVDAQDVALGAVRIPFPFTPVGFMVQVFDTDGLERTGDLTDQFVIAGDRVDLDGTGVTNPAATDVVHCIAWSA